MPDPITSLEPQTIPDIRLVPMGDLVPDPENVRLRYPRIGLCRCQCQQHGLHSAQDRASVFTAITGVAGWHDIPERVTATEQQWREVIAGQSPRWVTAIGTGVAIVCQHFLPLGVRKVIPWGDALRGTAPGVSRPRDGWISGLISPLVGSSFFSMLRMIRAVPLAFFLTMFRLIGRIPRTFLLRIRQHFLGGACPFLLLMRGIVAPIGFLLAPWVVRIVQGGTRQFFLAVALVVGRLIGRFFFFALWHWRMHPSISVSFVYQIVPQKMCPLRAK